jgi:hypothetical protein
VLDLRTSSASRNKSQGAVVACAPRFRAAEAPRFGPVKIVTPGSKLRATARVASAEPSSTTRISETPASANALSSVARRVSAALNAGMTTPTLVSPASLKTHPRSNNWMPQGVAIAQQ